MHGSPTDEPRGNIKVQPTVSRGNVPSMLPDQVKSLSRKDQVKRDSSYFAESALTPEPIGDAKNYHVKVFVFNYILNKQSIIPYIYPVELS